MIETKLGKTLIVVIYGFYSTVHTKVITSLDGLFLLH